jgi:hypothetical protein
VLLAFTMGSVIEEGAMWRPRIRQQFLLSLRHKKRAT